ncbi:MAG: ABC-F type ribosomal protection protein [Alicyclobacillus macrosporangiidus]|uniref:ribosomal protection-like ABC-F family protein n=1 Tax=Alicyclobacillus macrosporangiidus TaxID=392015 RepID=UPI0026F0C0C9|nr:ABC-F type ribosomal protection protein [Alicyclobacillus macrosporangiidus]MCL6600210.1 ABC-F type ribosomal protection protein [Alicyclobacillus macrosporangiidus]
MAFVIKAQGLCKEWSGKPLFQQVDFEVAEGERVALFGRNGVGKTTLIRGLMNQLPFDGGTVWRRYPVESWGWLEQHVDVDEGVSLLAFVRSGQPQLHQLRQRLDALQAEMERAASGSSPDGERQIQSAAQLEALADEYSRLHEQYLALEGYDWELQVEQTLSQFGFSPGQFTLPYANLSGGEKTRAQFARLVVRTPKLLILDEPTNHLDADTLTWLEDWLQNYAGSVLFVSHDRHFIDAVAHAVLELTPNGMRRYEGGYTAFRAQRDLEIKTQQALYDKQQREREQLWDAIRRYRQWYQQAHDAAGVDFHLRKKAEKNATRFKAKERALERLEAKMVPRPQADPSAQIQFMEGRFEGHSLLALHDVSFQYGPDPLFQRLNLRIRRGDKIAVIGSNGVGKSTLLKLITGRLQPKSGQVKRHPALRIGYFAQELDELDLSHTVLDTLLQQDGMTQSYARTVLAGFLFPKDEVFKRVGDLSMGERCRVAFVKLYFSEANLLVLDEPTNYLDIDARERMEEVLAVYPGALLMVSHDRYLVRKVANVIVHLERRSDGPGTAVSVFRGPYDEFLEHSGELSTLPAEQRDRIRQLELQLAQAIVMDPTEEVEQRALLEEIRRIRQELASLKGGGR